MVPSRTPKVTAPIRSGTVDVVVVGAGPAGAATALLLARAGRSVALLDRSVFPRVKPCGDCLSAEASRLLERLGVLDAVCGEAPARLEGWTITAPDGSAFTGRFPGDATALALSRKRLDHVLVRAAVDAGVRLCTGVRVTDVIRDARGTVIGVRGRSGPRRDVEVKARLVVGADGLRSVVARRLGLVRRRPRLRKASLTAHLRGVRGVGRRGELHLVDGACAGLAPVSAEGTTGAGTCNLTLVVDANRFGRRLARDRDAFFRHMVGRFPALRGRLDRAAFLRPDGDAGGAPGRALLASGPFDWPTRDVVVDGAALVGDAAGYYDPFTGQGIFRALASAELLADTADTALASGDVSARRLRRYARRRTRLLRGPRLLQRVIEFATARPALAARAIRCLGRAPAAADTLVAVTGDLLPVRSLLRPSLLASLVVHQLRPEAHHEDR